MKNLSNRLRSRKTWTSRQTSPLIRRLRRGVSKAARRTSQRQWAQAAVDWGLSPWWGDYVGD